MHIIRYLIILTDNHGQDNVAETNILLNIEVKHIKIMWFVVPITDAPLVLCKILL